MDNTEKVRENRVRRIAARQGFQLIKSRRRDPRAYDYGTYMLAHPQTNTLVIGGGPGNGGLSLDEMETSLWDGTDWKHCPVCDMPNCRLAGPHDSGAAGRLLHRLAQTRAGGS